MLMDLDGEDRLVLGKCQVRDEKAVPPMISYLSQYWPSSSKLVQCFYSDDAFVFAAILPPKDVRDIRDTGYAPLLLMPFRHFMKTGILKTSQFESKMLLLDKSTGTGRSENLISRLDLRGQFQEEGHSIGSDRPAAMRTHITLYHEIGASRVFEFNWVQIMYLESYVPNSQPRLPDEVSMSRFKKGEKICLKNLK
jgi:hypothetical protein